MFQPPWPPFLGEIVENLGGTPKPPAGCVLHLFEGIGELVDTSHKQALTLVESLLETAESPERLSLSGGVWGYPP